MNCPLFKFSSSDELGMERERTANRVQVLFAHRSSVPDVGRLSLFTVDIGNVCIDESFSLNWHCNSHHESSL